MNFIIEIKNKYFFLAKIFEFIINSLSLFIRFINKTRVKKSPKVLIISLHRLGDTVFTIPALNHLINHYKDKNIIIYTYPQTRLIYEAGNINSDYRTFEGKSIYFPSGKMISNIKEDSYDTIIDLTGSILSATIIMRLKSKKYYGINAKYFRLLYDEYCSIRKTPHLMDIYLDLLKINLSINIENSLKEFPVNFDFDKPIIIQPNAGWQAKEWGLSKFIKLYELLIKNYKCYFVFPDNFLSKEDIKELINNKIEFNVTSDINELIREIENCSVFIGNDSGPLNIATFLGKPTFCIYGPTNPLFHLPYNRNHDYIQKKILCSPPENEKYCFTDAGCNGCPSYECMNLLSVKEVYEKLSVFFERIAFKANSLNNKAYKDIERNEKET